MKRTRICTKAKFSLALVLAVTLSACGGGNESFSPTPLPSRSPETALPSPVPSSHVVLVVEENHRYHEVYPHGMPWLVAMGNGYGFASNYHANVAGSALNYFWLSSGSSEKEFGCHGWGCEKPITSNNIFRILNQAARSWKIYAESLPSVGWINGDSGAYVKRHNPAVWYADIINNPSEQQKVVPFTEFSIDLAQDQLPNYSIVIPDINHDAHDGTLLEADNWLQVNIGPLLDHPDFKVGGNGLLIVTFDECDAAVGACPQEVYTAVIGPNVKRGTQSHTLYRHENTLRTILHQLNISVYPGAAEYATVMSDFF